MLLSTFPHFPASISTALVTKRIYLFIAPIQVDQGEGFPKFSFHNPAYYWSFRVHGGSALKSNTQKLLGLSFYHPTLYGSFWNSCDYFAMSQYITMEGFDPHTQDYAREKGYPLFKRLNSYEEFEIINDTGSIFSISLRTYLKYSLC
jgi:hypothetical protein